jgi:hypothetical protein
MLILIMFLFPFVFIIYLSIFSRNNGKISIVVASKNEMIDEHFVKVSEKQKFVPIKNQKVI